MDLKKRFSEEQIIGFLKQAEAGVPIKELCRQHGFSDASFYTWRAKFRRHERSGRQAPEGIGNRECQAQALACRVDSGRRSAQSGTQPKTLSPQQKREAVTVMKNETSVSERRACQLVGLSRTVLRFAVKVFEPTTSGSIAWPATISLSGALTHRNCNRR